MSVWTLRCLFNRSGYQELALAGELTVQEKTRPRQPTANLPYVASVESYYRDPILGTEVARTHHYVCADGSIGASGERDPKSLFLNGVRYHPWKGQGWLRRVRRDPCDALPRGWVRVRRLYGRWRKWRCRRFGV